MNRPTNRLFAASAGLAACGLIITGCSSGQISQTADQESAVNGSTANVKNIALRNVHLQAVQTGDYLKPGRTVELVFAAVNTSADVNDKLLGITSDVGSVSITGDLAIPANSALIVGSADRTAEASPLASTEDAKAEVTLASRSPTADLRLHLHLRQGRRGQDPGADLGRCRPRQETAAAAHE